jgi:hypothetical protein
MQCWQRTAAVAGGHIRDQFPDGGAADVLGRAAFGDAQRLVPVGEAALLVVGAGGLDPQGGAALVRTCPSLRLSSP